MEFPQKRMESDMKQKRNENGSKHARMFLEMKQRTVDVLSKTGRRTLTQQTKTTPIPHAA